MREEKDRNREGENVNVRKENKRKREICKKGLSNSKLIIKRRKNKETRM